MSRTKPPSDKILTIRLPESELNHLEDYCIAQGKTKTEVVRELIRKLRLPKSS
jgi:predicted DNA-binding protein